MSKRSREYYRSQRERVIRRKEHILLSLGGSEFLQAWSHGHRGIFAKGKIHCSCPMCRRKSYENVRHRDSKIYLSMDDQIR